MDVEDGQIDLPLTIRVDRLTERRVVVSVCGELDMLTAPALDAALLTCRQPGEVVIDLTEVTFLDSSALKVMVNNAKQLGPLGSTLALQGLSSHQRNVLRLSGLNTVLNVR